VAASLHSYGRSRLAFWSRLENSTAPAWATYSSTALMNLQTEDWVTLFASAAGVALAVLVILRGRRSSLAIPLALLSIDFCCFNLATMFFDISKVSAFNILDKATSPFGIALGLHFVIAFVGRRRPFRWLLRLSYLFSGLTAATSPLSVWIPWARNFIDTRSGANALAGWALANIVHLVLALAVGMPLLINHYRNSLSGDERTRTRVVILAMAVLALGGGSEFLPNVPSAAPIAQTLFVLLLSGITLRLNLFDVRIPLKVVPFAVLAGLVAVAALVSLFKQSNITATLSMLIVMSGFLVLLTILVVIVAARAVHAERVEGLVLKGRVSSQLAHNLKNPLAAMKGTFQLLRVELDHGRSIEDQKKYVDLALEQVRRMETTLGQFERLGNVEPVPVPLQINGLVKNVLALQRPSEPERIRVRSELDESLPICEADPELLGQALENLVKNAFDAMPEGGELTVSTSCRLGDIVVAVVDTGCGMDARTQELVLTEFYTTKSNGSGQGLSFARRVAEAHGGRLSILSRQGEGTTVRLSLPV
jgi:two-component system, NtrC family, sensor histidine kinase HydH